MRACGGGCVCACVCACGCVLGVCACGVCCGLCAACARGRVFVCAREPVTTSSDRFVAFITCSFKSAAMMLRSPSAEGCFAPREVPVWGSVECCDRDKTSGTAYLLLPITDWLAAGGRVVTPRAILRSRAYGLALPDYMFGHQLPSLQRLAASGSRVAINAALVLGCVSLLLTTAMVQYCLLYLIVMPSNGKVYPIHLDYTQTGP